MNKNKQRRPTARREFEMLYARMPEGGPGQLSPGPRIMDSPRAPGGGGLVCSGNVVSPPPPAWASPGKERADVLTNVRERPARLLCKFGDRHILSPARVTFCRGVQCPDHEGLETLMSLLLPNQAELPPIVQQADNIKEENRGIRGTGSL